MRRIPGYCHLRLPPIGVLDLIFFLAYRGSGSWFNAYGAVILLVSLLAMGFLITMSSMLGVDLSHLLEEIYPLDLIDIPQSPLRREAAPAVLFCFPVAVVFVLLAYRRTSIYRVNSWYANRVASKSFLLGFMIFMACFFCMVAAGLLPNRTFTFPAQLLFLLVASYITGIERLLLSHST